MKRMIKKTQRGFTLIEIMVVVVVLGILAAVIVPNFMGKTDEAMQARAKSDIASLTSMIQAFRLDMHRVPGQDEGLDVLRNPPSGDDADQWKGPYASKAIPTDPWGTPYQYSAPAPNGIDEFGIASFGRDKAPGGTGLDADITSWDESETGGGDAGAAPADGGAASAAAPAQ